VARESEGVLSDAALRTAIDAASDGVLVVDESGTIIFANPMLVSLFGYDPAELIGSPIEMLIPETVRDQHASYRQGYTAKPRTRPMGSGLDLKGRHKDGSEFPVEIGLSPVRTEHGTSVIAIVRDVTERRLAADELRRAQERLALVDDRERIARDLHDTVIQRLFAVGLSLQGALIRAGGSAELAERIELAVDEIDGTIRDIRSSIFALQSRQGVSGGARDMVLHLGREASRALGFEPHVEFGGLVDTVMTNDVRDQLVPTLREALANIVKHAHATRVSIVVEADDDIVLRVTDDGIGITDAFAGGHGLANMVERAMLLGGTCILKPGDRGGTVLEWRVPAV
jgi:two-component system sensor histidine kinase DevS